MKRAINLSYFTLLTASLAGLSAFGSAASLASGLGIFGIGLSILLGAIALSACIAILRPLLATNARGVTMMRAISSVGLTDIENRQDDASPLPPDSYYSLAQREIVISTLTGGLTFQLHIKVIEKALDRGVKVCILLLHPDSAEESQLESHRGIRRRDIEKSIEAVVSSGLTDHAGFAIRFRNQPPPFTAIMLDGDLSPTGVKPNDKAGQIRVQPVTTYVPLQRGTVLQFKKIGRSDSSSFDYFAEDLRKQWALEGNEVPQMLDRKMT